VIEDLDIWAQSGDALTIFHRGVVVRNCRIRQTTGQGVYGSGATGLVLHNLDIVRTPRSEEATRSCNNVHLYDCRGSVLMNIRARSGSSNVYREESGLPPCSP
jgi:hypothetical protein